MKTMSSSQIQPQRKFRSRNRLLAAAVSSCFAASVAWANPVAPTVVNGVATFSQVGNVLTVTNSNGTIINWDKFSIGSGETTNFIQSSASSSVLNRVLSNDPSQILGTLSSNGKVWLINPAGIMVGAGARVDVAGFVASTLNVTDANFLAGKLLFDATPGTGSVVNQGTITTPSGGSVYLIAPNVQNAGVITTPGGETVLAAGQTVALLDTGTPGVKVEITGAEGNATNLGTILADAGRIGMAGVLVRNSGTLNASSVVNEGGRIFLKASQDAYVDGNGRIVTTGTKGGSVEVLGNRVAVMDNASVNASGTGGGGTVLVGGDYQGSNAAIQNSQITYVGAGVSIKADAKTNGNGGKVIVWSDGITRVYGAISALGGALSGNGGFVETSGKQFLDVTRAANVGASAGKSGTWLLDPTDLTIVHGASDTGVTGSSPFEPFTGNSGSQLSDSTINSGLVNGNVQILTSYGGDIRFDGSSNGSVVITSANSGRSLSVSTGGDIKFDGVTTFQTTGSGTLGITFNPNSKVEVSAGATLSLAGAGGSLWATMAGIGGKTWENYGTVNLSGNSAIDLENAGYLFTFNNRLGGVLNLTSSAGWSFYSNASDAGGIFNAGTINVNGTAGSGNYDAWEAGYYQASTGVLNIGAGKILSMQNADEIFGSVTIGANGRLMLTETHAGARTFFNTTITGPGALDTQVATTFSGVTLNGATLANSAGDLAVPTGIVSYLGNVGLYAAGDVNFASGSNLSTPGGLTVRAGWNGGGFGSATTSGVNAGTGTIFVDGATVTAASMDWMAGSGIHIWANNSSAAYVSSTSNQTMTVTGTGGDISVSGGTGGGHNAVLTSLSGTQSLTSGIIGVYGGGADASDGNFAVISANGTQNLNLTGPGYVEVIGGGYQGGGSQNFSKIEQLADGGSQTINFASGGLITVSGGTGLSDNFASIDGHGGSLSIGGASGTNRPDIYLIGGYMGGTWDHSNSAEIGLNDVSTGALTVYAAGITINAGTAAYGGAGFGASTQRFYLNGNLNMFGGSSTNLDKDNVPGGAAYIGAKYGADIMINTTGAIHLQGGSGSPVVIGSLSGTANVSITTGTAAPVMIYSNSGGVYGGVFIGSREELAPSANGFFSNDVMLGSHTSVISGGDVTIQSYGGNVGLGYIKAYHGAGYGASVIAAKSILDQNGAALNVEADNIWLESYYGGASGGLAISADTKVTDSAGWLEAYVGYDYTANYGGISIRNTDVAGFGLTGNIDIEDYSLSGGNISFFNSASLTLSGNTFFETDSGDLLIATAGDLTSNGFTGYVADGGSMLLGAGGNITINGNTAASYSYYYQDIGLVAAGDISLQSGYLTGNNISLISGGALNVTGGNATTSSGAMQVVAGNVNVDGSSGGYLRSYADMEIVANNVTLTNGGHLDAGFSSPNPTTDISIAVKGDLRLNNGAYIIAGNDIYLDLLGSNSTLYLNDGLTASQAPSYIWADAYGIPMTTHINLPSRSAGGIVINGMNATTTTVGGSGFFNGFDVNFDPIPGVLGSSVVLTYGAADNPVVNAITQANNNSTKDNNLADKTTTTSLILKPVGTTTANNQTVGGDSDDSFGGSEKKDDKDANGNSGTKDKNNGKSTSKNQCS